jgi:hypothetical protein
MRKMMPKSEMDLNALSVRMHEEQGRAERQSEQARPQNNANALVRFAHRADAWLQRVSEEVLASFA